MKTVKNKKCIIFLFLILAGLSSCLKEEDLNLRYEGFKPEFVAGDWEISTPESENMDPLIIEKLYRDFYNEKLYPNIRSLLIVRNGKLMAEAYCKDFADRDELHHIMSATKCFTSILTGIALDKGFISTIDTTVYAYIPQYFDEDPKKKDITIRNVLTMETGLNFDNEIHSSELIDCVGSSLEYVLHQEMVFAPGTDWYYGDGNPQIISGIIQSETGKTEAEFAEEFLFKPLMIENYFWESLNDGLTVGSIGLWLRPRDMAKIGWLMAQKGKWNGEIIVSEEWVNESTKNQSSHRNYGFYWKPLEDIGFYAEGHGGQILWVYPGKNLVVVITSDSYAKTYNLSKGYESFYSEILGAIND